jgi:hypothetical protein
MNSSDERQRALKVHEKLIQDLQAKCEASQADIDSEEGLRAKVDAKLQVLALKAAGGDRGALRAQQELKGDRDRHTLQIDNLAAAARPICAELADAQKKLPVFQRAAIIGRLRNRLSELPARTVDLGSIVPPVAKKFAEYGEAMHADTGEALSLIARGDPARIRSLEDRVRNAFLKGLRSQLSHDFHAVGIALWDVSRHDPPTFDLAVAPVLLTVIEALQVDLLEDQLSDGRALYKCLTNVSGLLGVHLSPGEVVSLPVDHPDVRKMLALEAIEEVDAVAPSSEKEESESL